MPETANIDTVELSSAVDEFERLWKLAKQARRDAEEVLLCSLLGRQGTPAWFAEMRDRIAAGKSTMDDDPPVVEGDESIPIAEYVAEVSGELEIFLAACAWLIDAQDSYESTARETLPIPAELAEAARRYAAEAEQAKGDGDA